MEEPVDFTHIFTWSIVLPVHTEIDQSDLNTVEKTLSKKQMNH